MTIIRKARDILAPLFWDFIHGAITESEFLDKLVLAIENSQDLSWDCFYKDCPDGGIRIAMEISIDYFLDTFISRLTGKHALEDPELSCFERVALFLESDFEYEWGKQITQEELELSGPLIEASWPEKRKSLLDKLIYCLDSPDGLMHRPLSELFCVRKNTKLQEPADMNTCSLELLTCSLIWPFKRMTDYLEALQHREEFSGAYNIICKECQEIVSD